MVPNTLGFNGEKSQGTVDSVNLLHIVIISVAIPPKRKNSAISSSKFDEIWSILNQFRYRFMKQQVRVVCSLVEEHWVDCCHGMAKAVCHSCQSFLS